MGIKKMAGGEEGEFSVTETIENKLEIVLRADETIEASIQAGIAAGNDQIQNEEMAYWSSIVGQAVASGIITPDFKSALGEKNAETLIDVIQEATIRMGSMIAYMLSDDLKKIMEHLTKPVMAKLFEIKLAVEQMNAGIEMERGSYNPSKIWNDMRVWKKVLVSQLLSFRSKVVKHLTLYQSFLMINSKKL